ncbi:MAG TPA: hypothetical protein VJM11_00230 [Nevskiaceae bacterium]|nr:hypothetical protein [Nevskiaceae bacterium]
MALLRFTLSAAALALATTSAYAVDATTQANAEAVNAACKTDAEASGCTGKVVGTGLIKCMADYKKAHPEFKFTEGCKAATAKGFADYKATHPPATTTPSPGTPAP